ncbi:MAG TPA: sugar transferase [Gemmatimonadaceae bacterium]|nr:sugar transferase [Gemmatimonadaceae bacterium]
MSTIGSAQQKLEPLINATRAPLATRTEAQPAPDTVVSFDTRDEFEPGYRSELANRIMNVAVASIALLIVSPILIACAILIKLTSRGPVFYRQVRIGIDQRWKSATKEDDRRLRDLGGRAFTIYKFRSMYVNAEQCSGAVWATRNDCRVTPIGKFIRKCRIDEIPQLFNVIKGDMNIVGPRPERPTIFARLCESIVEYPIRQRAKPGITGWAQINHSYDATIDDVRTKVRYDLEYLQRHGLAEDLLIMARTLPVMIFGRGAV